MLSVYRLERGGGKWRACSSFHFKILMLNEHGHMTVTAPHKVPELVLPLDPFIVVYLN